ncbi:MAG: hypothetical protein CMH57_01455 [Myxococcales bacterium]|nr:hypothetical protein [Myxococcales bacterium]
MGKKLKAVKPPPDTQDQARAILADGGDVSAVSQEHWLWMAEEAGDRADLETLRALEARITGKAFQKGLRRVHHKLRTRGVELTRTPHAVSVAPRREFQGVATLASSEGSFLAYLACHSPGESSLAVLFQSMGGELRVEPGWMPRGDARRGLRDTLAASQEEMAWYELEEGYARFFLFELVRGITAEGFDSELVEMKATLGELPEAPARHPVEEALEARGVEVPRSVATSGDLLDDPFYGMLRPTYERVAQCVERFEAVEVSPLVLADHQIMDRLRAVVDGVLVEMVEEAGRARVALGLRHTAWVSARHDRWGEAALLTRVARLVEEGTSPSEIPLFLAMFQPLLIEFHARMTAPASGGVGEMGTGAAPIGGGGDQGEGGLWVPGRFRGDD